MIIRKLSPPFKGICQDCGKRTLVRLYPYNDFEWYGVCCKYCFKEFDDAMAEFDWNYVEEDYD